MVWFKKLQNAVAVLSGKVRFERSAVAIQTEWFMHQNMRPGLFGQNASQNAAVPLTNCFVTLEMRDQKAARLRLVQHLFERNRPNRRARRKQHHCVQA